MTTDECRTALRTNQPVTSLGALIEVAVEDARGLDREVYEPRWTKWHESLILETDDGPRKVCAVCDAGAVIAGTLGRTPGNMGHPVDFQANTRKALEALDMVRRGNLAGAFDELDLARNGWLPASSTKMRGDYISWEGFDRHLRVMEKLAAQIRKLEKMGHFHPR